MSDMDERNDIAGDSGVFDESESAEVVDSSRSEDSSSSDSVSSDAGGNIEGNVGAFDPGSESDVKLIDGSRGEDIPSDESSSELVVSEPVASEPVVSESSFKAHVPSVEVKSSDDKFVSDKTDRETSSSDDNVSQDDVSESASSMSFSQALSESVTIASSGEQISPVMIPSITNGNVSSQKEKTNPYVFHGPDGNTYITDNVNTLLYDSGSEQYFKHDPILGVSIAVDDATVSGYFGNSRIVNGEICSVQDKSQNVSSKKTKQDKTISSKRSREGAHHNNSNDKKSYNGVGSLASAFEASDTSSKHSIRRPSFYHIECKGKVSQMQYETAKVYLNLSSDNDKDSIDTEFGS